MARTYIGVSGWSYESWRGDFYPEGLSRKDELAYVGRRFNSVEINGTFYSLQDPDTFRSWHEATPADFRFAVKGSQYITHSKKLKDPEAALANFFAQGVLLLEDKLGPILWQLPDNFSFDEERAGGFLELLPGNTEEAADLASKHDDRVKGRSWTKTDRRRRVRHALEIRDESWFRPELVRLARRAGVALVFSHAGDWRCTEELTAGFVYLRLHGAPETYASRYDDDGLDRWADRIRRWRSGEEPPDPARITDRKPPRRKTRDIYAYFDNDSRGHAPRDALRLAERVGMDPEPPSGKERETEEEEGEG